MKAYLGKILIVDLNDRTFEERTIPDTVYERYLSGVGLAARVCYDLIPAGADPLGPDNVIGFASGLLTGTGTLFSGRWMVTGKSPLTGGWGDANCGGNFGPAIKKCGYDAIFVRGISSEPVYIFADGKKVEIRSAAYLWGKDAIETESELIAESGDLQHARVACIGNAGEKLSLISGILNDRGRLAARSGLGAVMGSKKLKAILLVGSRSIPCADAVAVQRLGKECSAYVPKGELKLPTWLVAVAGWAIGSSTRAIRLDGVSSLPIFRKWGTSSGMQVGLLTGDTPVKNWKGIASDYSLMNLDPLKISKNVLKRYYCYACPLGCGALMRDGAHRPEYETIAALGPLSLNGDLNSIFQINELLIRAGMDSISTGTVLAFAIDCFENGLLSEIDTDGLRLNWGNTDALIKLVRMMIAREGLGDILADGVKVAAQRIGRGAERFAIHAGGQELPLHDPKYDSGYGIHYIADPTPGRHTIGANMTYETLRLWKKVSWVPEIPSSYPASQKYAADANKGIHAAGAALVKMLIDGAGLCNFGLMLGVDRFPLFEYLNAATGWQLTPDGYMELGRRAQTLRQIFTLREGVDPAQVKLPGITHGDPPIDRGQLKGKRFDVYEARKHTWQALGWNPETGVPLEETKRKLGLLEQPEVK